MGKHVVIKLSNPIEKHFNVLSRYHYFFYFFLFSSLWPVFWHFIGSIFTTPLIDFYCNSTVVTNNTKNLCPCDNPWWDRSIFMKTVKTKYNLQCDKQWLEPFSQSMYYVGSLFGSLGFGLWSDKFGRRSACTNSCFLVAFSGCLVIVMPTIATYILMRTVQGAACGGYFVATFVFAIEFSGFNHREIISALYHLPPNLGHASLAGVSYLLRDCDNFQLAISIPVFFFVTIKCLTLESPKWLMDKHRVEEAADVMNKIAEFNNVPCPGIKAELEAYMADHTSSSKPEMKLIEIFKQRKLSIDLACMSVIYFVCGMGFYGVTEYIGQMSGNIHLNVAISGALLIPGTLTATVLLKVLNRRIFLMISNFLSGFFMLTCVLIPSKFNFLRVIFACICNCFFFMCQIGAFLFGTELFTTPVRSSTLGFLSLVSRVGTIIAPQLNASSHLAAGLTFGIIALIGAVLCYPLPETKNTELPSTLQDTQEIIDHE